MTEQPRCGVLPGNPARIGAWAGLVALAALSAGGAACAADPAPSLAQFEKYVTEGKIHYYISGGRGLGAGGFGGTSGGTSDVASQISTWVESHFTAKTVDGTTLYNLTAPTTSS